MIDSGSVKQYLELLHLKKDLEERIEALKNTLIDEMVLSGADTLVVGGVKLSYTFVSSMRFDTKSFKEDSPEIYTRYLKDASYWRFTAK